jgi:two-component system CheB/CheR fusion protein
LAAAKRGAEAASRAKDHFLAVLSHELRTPLTPVVAALSILQRQQGGFDPETREHLEMIGRNVELEARLIDDLLDVTRIEKGKIDLDRKPIMLCEVLRRAVEVCQSDIEARRLEFGVDARDFPYIVNADATRLQQVFWNLLRNAIKFTPAGGCIGIRCRRLDDTAIVEVNDSGEGIEPEALTRVFNAFEQAERSITRQFGGLGLGLAISKALVEMHGGTIAAHSPGKGKGATFTVRLPICSSQPAATTPPGDRSRPPAADRTLRILLVEDHGDTARIMRRLLQGRGHEVQTAADVASALEATRRGQFDLLISDLGLPDGSGMDLMRRFVAEGGRAPAIALSGYGQEQDIAQSREAGFAAHLTKPVNMDQLVSTIIAVTGQSFAPPRMAQERNP